MINGKKPTVLDFFQAFLCNPMEVGAIAPSSKELARAMVGDLALAPNDAVLELGPGTGAFTRQIRRVIPDQANYLGIERELRFFRILQERFPELSFVNGNAEDTHELCRETRLGPVKAVISGLPFAGQRAAVQDQIIDSVIQVMAPGSVFRTFQYVHAYAWPSAIRFRHQMNGVFGRVSGRRMLIGNLPPAYVLTWEHDAGRESASISS